MANRARSVDPGLLLWLLQHGGQRPANLDDVSEHQSGCHHLGVFIDELVKAVDDSDRDISAPTSAVDGTRGNEGLATAGALVVEP